MPVCCDSCGSLHPRAELAGLIVLTLAYELNLSEGIRLERRVFHSMFATKDQKEGSSGSRRSKVSMLPLTICF